MDNLFFSTKKPTKRFRARKADGSESQKLRFSDLMMFYFSNPDFIVTEYSEFTGKPGKNTYKVDH